jgi:hypothetical protein
MEQHAQSVLRAQDAAVKRAESQYVMGSFTGQHPGTEGERFNHLFWPPTAISRASLCGRLAVSTWRRAEYPVAQLHQVDCLGCLDRFTELTRPVAA